MNKPEDYNIFNRSKYHATIEVYGISQDVIMMSKLGNFYIGYSYSWGGAVIGLIWGFFYGFIAGVLIAWLYDLFCKIFYKSKKTAE